MWTYFGNSASHGWNIGVETGANVGWLDNGLPKAGSEGTNSTLSGNDSPSHSRDCLWSFAGPGWWVRIESGLLRRQTVDPDCAGRFFHQNVLRPVNRHYIKGYFSFFGNMPGFRPSVGGPA
jgi:hypothetical protein